MYVCDLLGSWDEVGQLTQNPHTTTILPTNLINIRGRDNDEEEKLAFDSLWIAEPFGCSAEASWVEEIC